MKTKVLIIKTSILAILLIATYLGASYKTTQGSVDKYYSKFTHKGGSLIIGLSRARDGLSPAVIEREFGDVIHHPVLNFAFEKTQSMFGDVLLKSIKQKIDTTSNNGLFILSVTPGSFFISKKMNDEFSQELDKNTLICKMDDFNKHPNFEYIRKCYSSPLYKTFFNKTNNDELIRVFHDDGWLEFKNESRNYKMTDTRIKTLKKIQYEGYTKMALYEKKSEYRISKFKETITYLQQHGTVILIRMPLDEDFLQLENDFFENFDNRIIEISIAYKVPYFNYTTSKKYKTYDGSHLFSESAKRLTKKICDDIKSHQKSLP